MKQKVTLHDNISHKDVVKEVIIPNKLHLQAQIDYKASAIKPKKGKGSYSRKLKHKGIKEE